MMSRLASGLLTVAVLFSACAEDGAGPTATYTTVSGGQAGLFASQLVEFDSCEAFLDHIKADALERVGPYGFGGGGRIEPFMAVATTTMAAEATIEAAAENVTAAEGVEYSTTNVQEIGVDEPDIVKTDGLRILALAQGLLHYVDVSSATPVLVSVLEIGSPEDRNLWDHQLFMSGDTALLMASGYADGVGLTTVAMQIDLTTPEELRITDTLTVEGTFVSARLVGERVALVLSLIHI